MSTNHPPFENGQQYPQTFTAELAAAPTAWQSIPSPVRFAVWVWAISVIIGVGGAVLFAILFALGMGAALS